MASRGQAGQLASDKRLTFSAYSIKLHYQNFTNILTDNMHIVFTIHIFRLEMPKLVKSCIREHLFSAHLSRMARVRERLYLPVNTALTRIFIRILAYV